VVTTTHLAAAADALGVFGGGNDDLFDFFFTQHKKDLPQYKK